MTGVKIKEAQRDQEDSSRLATRIEDQMAIARVCLRACGHSDGIDQTDILKFNEL
jgi:hypothetical protein